METDNNMSSLEERFAVSLLNNLSQEDIQGAREAAKKLVEEFSKDGNDTGLLYGRVQSGKTNGMIMSIARANDNEFRFFVVLTSDNVSLYTQTLDRIRTGLPTLYVLGNEDFNRESEIIGRVRTAMKNKGIVIVTKKNSRNLQAVESFLDILDVSQSTAVVMDDEADFGSLNSRQNQDEQSRIHQLITRLRNKFGITKFVQVTATPQPIFLQSVGSNFRPTYVVPVKPGAGYIGGKNFFDVENPTVVDNVQRHISPDEILSIVENDNYSSFDLTGIPKGIRSAVCTFLVGSSCKKITNGNGGKHTMLCHISSRQKAHRSLYSLVSRYVEILSESLSTSQLNTGIHGDLKNAYDDINRTFSPMPTFESVLSVIRDNIFSTNIQIIIGGGTNQAPSYDSPFNIIIGGERLGRGLTIPNLIVTYYGRTTNAPKVDTILQHSRMYGYRSSNLNVMRFFSTEQLFNTYFDVYISDEEEWEYFSLGSSGEKMPVVLSLRHESRVRPTRNAVIPMENILKYFPGKAYIMYDASDKNTSEIDEALVSFNNEDDCPKETTFEKIQELLELFENTRAEQRWNRQAIATAIDGIKKANDVHHEGQGTVISPRIVVRRDRNIKNGYRSVLSSSDNVIREDNSLILFAYRLNGKKDDGWNQKPVWVPVIRFPSGDAFYFVASYTVPNEGEETGDNE